MAWNLGGHAIPVLAALVAIPVLIRYLGVERFGLLTLVWALVGYAGTLDVGLGRAMTIALPAADARGERDRVARIASTGLVTMTVLGAAIGAILLGVAAVGPGRWLAAPAELADEVRMAFAVLAPSVPLIVSTAALRGNLEAFGRFRIVGLLRMPSGIATYAAPLLAIPFDGGLPAITALLVAARALIWGAHLMACRHHGMLWITRPAIDRAALRQLLTMGGWLTLSALLVPCMLYVDRAVIAGFGSLTGLAHYATSLEAVTRLWIVPTALVGVLVPMFSARLAAARDALAPVFRFGVLTLLAAMAPVVLVLIAFARPLLQLWLGEDFAAQAAPLFACLAFGVLVNSAAHVPAGLLVAAGRPAFLAAAILVELPLYAAMLAVLLDAFGPLGAAIAWTLRSVVDTAAFFAAAAYWCGTGARPAREAAVIIALVGVVGAVAATIEPLGLRAVAVATGALLIAGIVWHALLDAGDRRDVLDRLHGLAATRDRTIHAERR